MVQITHLSERRGAQQLAEWVETGVRRRGGALLLQLQVLLQRILAFAVAPRHVEAESAPLRPRARRQRRRQPLVTRVDQQQVVQQAEREVLAARRGGGAEARAQRARQRLHEGLHARKPARLHTPNILDAARRHTPT